MKYVVIFDLNLDAFQKIVLPTSDFPSTRVIQEWEYLRKRDLRYDLLLITFEVDLEVPK